ncbi:MAG: DUF5691 domain-containing protein [Comamonas sp.]
MSQANLWAALQQSSLVGAERLAIPPVLLAADAQTPATVQAVQMAYRQAATSTAAQLLRASAVAAVLERAGWAPGAQVKLAAPLAMPVLPGAESRPAPDDATLALLMRDMMEEGPPELHAQSFAVLGSAGMRLPFELLVPALNLGRQSTDLREWLMPVLGERGRWLAMLNPQWSYAAGVQETATAELIWQEGSIAQRVSLLESERATDPAKARERLESSLKELNAKERAPMVQALQVGLAMDDEPLLEKLLADRSKEVRDNAANLLTNLPGSAHSLRMIGRLQAMLGKNAKGEWQIEPPEESSKDWERDGVVLQPPSYIKGQRAWWLQQMVELSPVGWWLQTLDKTPEQLWEWSRHSDWKTALRQGWLAALQTQPDLRWLPLLRSMDQDSRAQNLLPAMLDQLTHAQREALWMADLEARQGKSMLIHTINKMDDSLSQVATLSPAMSEWIVDALYKATRGKQAQGNWHSWEADQSVLACARRLDASTLVRFADLWREPDINEAVPAAVVEPKAPIEGPNAEANADAIARLKAEQAARQERARLRPWDDERMLAMLNRIVNLRLALHAATQA